MKKKVISQMIARPARTVARYALMAIVWGTLKETRNERKDSEENFK